VEDQGFLGFWLFGFLASVERLSWDNASRGLYRRVVDEVFAEA
jgi:hypothetical protein